MKSIILVTLFFFSGTETNFSYRPFKLYEMILGADKIVFGEIESLNTTSFKFKIDKNLTGNETELTIEKFEDWACAYRWTDYKAGQKLFLFLRVYDGKLHAMSGGNEGELPVIKESIFLHGLTLNIPPPPGSDIYDSDIYFEYERHKVYGEYFRGCKVNFEKFVRSVQRIRKCFKIEYGKYNNVSNAKILCNEKNIAENIKSDKILRWTYLELKNIRDKSDNITVN